MKQTYPAVAVGVLFCTGLELGVLLTTETGLLIAGQVSGASGGKTAHDTLVLYTYSLRRVTVGLRHTGILIEFTAAGYLIAGITLRAGVGIVGVTACSTGSVFTNLSLRTVEVVTTTGKIWIVLTPACLLVAVLTTTAIYVYVCTGNAASLFAVGGGFATVEIGLTEFYTGPAVGITGGVNGAACVFTAFTLTKDTVGSWGRAGGVVFTSAMTGGEVAGLVVFAEGGIIFTT